MPKIKLRLSIGYVGAVRTGEEEIEDELWDSLDEDGREKLLDEIAAYWSNDYIELSAKVIE